MNIVKSPPMCDSFYIVFPKQYSLNLLSDHHTDTLQSCQGYPGYFREPHWKLQWKGAPRNI